MSLSNNTTTLKIPKKCRKSNSWRKLQNKNGRVDFYMPYKNNSKCSIDYLGTGNTQQYVLYSIVLVFFFFFAQPIASLVTSDICSRTCYKKGSFMLDRIIALKIHDNMMNDVFFSVAILLIEGADQEFLGRFLF